MSDRKFEIIQQLMDELQSMMEPTADDMNARLGREKPEMAIMKVEGEGDPMGMSEDMPMDEMDPEEKLKQRLMKLRGA